MYFLVDHQAGEVDSLLLRFLLQHLLERIVATFPINAVGTGFPVRWCTALRGLAS